MASAYTIEVILGKAKTVEDYAKLCIMGFGATSHLKNEPVSTPYRKAKVDQKNKASIRKLNKTLEEFNQLTNEQLYNDEKKALKESRLHFLNKIVEIKEAKIKLVNLLREVELWTPPSGKYDKLKELMITELKKTIDVDCDLKPVNNLIQEIEGKLSTIDPEDIRKKHVDALNLQIEYHQESHNNDVKHVKSSNEWVKELMKSFNK